MTGSTGDSTEISKLSSEEVQQICSDVIASVIGTSSYSQSDVTGWSNAIMEQSLASLSKSVKGYKLIVTCILMQKTGAGLNTSASCFWDPSTDYSCTTRWENKTLTAIVQVFAVAIWYSSRLFLLLVSSLLHLHSIPFPAAELAMPVRLESDCMCVREVRVECECEEICRSEELE